MVEKRGIGGRLRGDLGRRNGPAHERQLGMIRWGRDGQRNGVRSNPERCRASFLALAVCSNPAGSVRTLAAMRCLASGTTMFRRPGRPQRHPERGGICGAERGQRHCRQRGSPNCARPQHDVFPVYPWTMAASRLKSEFLACRRWRVFRHRASSLNPDERPLPNAWAVPRCLAPRAAALD